MLLMESEKKTCSSWLVLVHAPEAKVHGFLGCSSNNSWSTCTLWKTQVQKPAQSLEEMKGLKVAKVFPCHHGKVGRKVSEIIWIFIYLLNELAKLQVSFNMRKFPSSTLLKFRILAELNNRKSRRPTGPAQPDAPRLLDFTLPFS